MKRLWILMTICLAGISVSAESQKKTRSEKENTPGPGHRTVKKTGETEKTTLPVITLPRRKPDSETRSPNGSLYSENALNGELLSDFRARRAGDLIFVDVIETSSASVSSGAKRSRESGNLGGLSSAIRNLPLNGAAATAGVLEAMGTRQYEGAGATQRSSRLQARVAARVTEVLPNGDLLIEARKQVRINREDELLRLSGLVRQRDVSADNSVPTTAVGNLSVELNGRGMASADNAPGWLFRLFEKISPF